MKIDLNLVSSWLEKLNNLDFSDFETISQNTDNTWGDESDYGDSKRTTVLYIAEGVFAEVVEHCDSYGREKDSVKVRFVTPKIKTVTEYEKQ